MPHTDREQARVLSTLERLIAIPTADLQGALSLASDLVAEALDADKVDTFLFDESRKTLVAYGSSNQPLSVLQKKHGLDVLPVANGGRVAEVFQTGATFVSGRIDEDAQELRGIKEALGVRSELGVPLEVGGARRGVLLVASRRPGFFTDADVRFAERIARPIGNVAHRAQLVAEIARNSVEEGRRAVGEEMITTLAHDLRNFLAPVELRVAAVRRRVERDGRPADARDLELAQKGLTRLRGIISDILDVARIDQGVLRIDPHPVDLVPLLQECATTLARPDQSIHVRADDDVMIVADAARVRQCVENLLSNSVRFSPKGSPVIVQLGVGEGVARIEVIDLGPGVAPEVLPHLFQRFATGEHKNGGLGLGLYIAKRIALLHGGDLTVDTAPGKGTRFILTLPCA